MYTTKEDQLTFINENSELMTESNVKTLFRSLYDSKFNKISPLWVRDGSRSLFYNRFVFSLIYDLSIEENIKRLTDYISSKNVKVPEFQNLMKVYSLFHEHSFRVEDETKDFYYCGSVYGNNELVYLLLLLENGYFDADYSTVYDIFKKDEINNLSTDFSVKVGGLSLKRYKNGKVAIKGLSNEQRNKIAELIETVKRLNRYN